MLVPLTLPVRAARLPPPTIATLVVLSVNRVITPAFASAVTPVVALKVLICAAAFAAAAARVPPVMPVRPVMVVPPMVRGVGDRQRIIPDYGGDALVGGRPVGEISQPPTVKVCFVGEYSTMSPAALGME